MGARREGMFQQQLLFNSGNRGRESKTPSPVRDMAYMNVDEVSGHISGLFQQDIMIREKLYTSNGFNVGKNMDYN